ncbi:MAG: molybdopterin-dependent oxidoreductase [Anaerolineae bacterium]|nr:molybdopterin-dependent oxidoreductase [Anaerolineae bacterium]
MTRRQLLQSGLILGLGTAVLAACRGQTPAPTPTMAAQATPTLPAATSSPPPTPRPTAPVVEGMRITPNKYFYTVFYQIEDPQVDIAAWRLEVKGLVERPLSLSLDDIRALPSVTEMRTLECISNPIGGSLIGNAVWKGVRLKTILDMAGLKPDIDEVYIESFDNYYTSIPLLLGLDENSLLVYEMNGEPLPSNHGAPLRALWPGRYGMKQPKWITKISLIQGHRAGYWELQDGWSAEARIKINSQVESIEPMTVLTLGQVITLAGRAFANEVGVSKVEVSADDGVTWKEPELVRGPAATRNLVWTLWSTTWLLDKPGAVYIQARATDNAGNTQKLLAGGSLAGTYPDGSDGIHRVFVRVAEPDESQQKG